MNGVMWNTANKNLIDSKDIKQLLDQTKDVVDELRVSAWSVIKSFFISIFDIKENIKDKFLDFSKYKSKEALELLIKTLITYRENCNHKYKKLHYTYIISKVKNRINELEINNGEKMTDYKNLLCSIQAWDIMLISYSSKWLHLNSLLNNFANNTLRYFSDSTFAHVWIIWNGNYKSWFNRIHSTLHNDGGRTWVKEVNLENYLNEIKPSKLLIVRYNSDSKNSWEKIIEEWLKNVKEQTNYDTRDAIWDLFWFNALRKNEAFNCWELVYDCLKAIDSNLQIEKSGLPSSYINNKKLEQEYLTFVNEI